MTDSSRVRAVVDEHALGDPQLIGSQANTSCGVHRGEHVGDHYLQGVTKVIH
jgi:hypothetical protein